MIPIKKNLERILANMPSELNEPAESAVYKVIAKAVASAWSVYEGFLDLYFEEVNEKIKKSNVGTKEWLIDTLSKYQHGDNIILDTETLRYYYPTDEAEKRILSRISIFSTVSKQVKILLAKNEPAEKLTSGELLSVQSYINTVGVLGVDYVCESYDPSTLTGSIIIKFKGYQEEIDIEVKKALTDYFASFGKNNGGGILYLGELKEVLQAVSGVRNVIFENLYLDTVQLVSSKTEIISESVVRNGYLDSTIYPTLNYVSI